MYKCMHKVKSKEKTYLAFTTKNENKAKLVGCACVTIIKFRVCVMLHSDILFKVDELEFKVLPSCGDCENILCMHVHTVPHMAHASVYQ